MRILIIGGTGTIGSYVVRRLLAERAPLRVLTTSIERAKYLPHGVDPFIGNLERPDTYFEAFKGVTHVFMVNQQSENEIGQSLFAIELAKEAAVAKFVYLSIHKAHAGDTVSHFKPKIMTEYALRGSGMNYVFICPGNFYQNDLCFKTALNKDKMYDQPLGNIGLSRVDLRDVAEAVSVVIYTSRFDRQRIVLAGPDVWTGERTASQLSKQLNMDITYTGDDLKSFKNKYYLYHPRWIVDEWSATYNFYQKNGSIASLEEEHLLRKVLDREPICYEQFLTDYRHQLTR